MTEHILYFLKRREKRITQTELADYLKCSQALISKFESGMGSMSQEKINQYRQYIDEK